MVDFIPSTEAQIWCATQPVTMMQYLISPLFIFILFYVCMTLPFIALGIMNVWTRVGNWSKQRAGYIKIRKRLSNLHWIEFWAKPTGRKVTIEAEEGIEMELPIEIKEGMLGLEKEIDSHFDSDKPVKKGKPKKAVKEDDVEIETKKVTPDDLDTFNKLLGKQNRTTEENALLGSMMERVVK